MVCPDCVRKSIFTKQAPEGRLGALGADGWQRFAEQEHPAEVVCHGQRKTVLPVAGFELTLEVGWPDLVGACGLQTNGSGMFPRPPTPVLAKVVVLIQDLVDRTAGRKAPIRMPPLQNLA